MGGDDPSRFFRSLDIDGTGELMCEDLLEVLEMHNPLLMQRMMQRRLDAEASRAATQPPVADAGGQDGILQTGTSGRATGRQGQALDSKLEAGFRDASPAQSE